MDRAFETAARRHTGWSLLKLRNPLKATNHGSELSFLSRNHGSNGAFLAGGPIGGNYQIGNFVIGGEWDSDWVSSHTGNGVGIPNVGTLAVTENNRWTTTVSLRLHLRSIAVLRFIQEDILVERRVSCLQCLRTLNNKF